MIIYRKGGDKMKWEDVRQAFPNQWVLIEAIHAFTNENSERILEEVVALKKFTNAKSGKPLLLSMGMNRFFIAHLGFFW
jgi:hypothetical protein